MSFDLSHLLLVGIAYLLLLFGIAHAGERGIIPLRLLRHPVVYTLSLGVFASVFAIYGVVALAHETGYGFMSYYAGVAGAFLFAPLLLVPVLRICRAYQLDSVADLLTFRFRSQAAGSAITLFTLLAMLPLLALQIQVVVDTVHILTNDPSRALDIGNRNNLFAIGFCAVIGVFTILFGSKRRGNERRHNGLVAAIAFDSLVKVLLMVTLGGVAVYGVFGGFAGLEQWLASHPQQLESLRGPMRENASRSQLLLFFAATLCMPHMFHMTFAERPTPQALQTASWGMSVYLILLSLPVLPILWAGLELGTLLPPEYFTLALGVNRESPLLALFVYIGSLSAASGCTIVITLALASMCLNHLVLPIYQPDADRDIFRWLLWVRRILITAIIAAGYLLYRTLISYEDPTSLAMSAYVGALQFLPGVLATLYWPRANRIGLLGGLGAGFLVWLLALLLPLVTGFNPAIAWGGWFEIDETALTGAATLASLAANTSVFALLSLLLRPSDEEQAAAEVCSIDDLNRPIRRTLLVRDAAEFTQRLATVLGHANAEREVSRALQELKLQPNERRPFAMRRLRDRLEVNLSGMMGPATAHDIIDRLLPYRQSESSGIEDINLIEARLERYQSSLKGLAADLNSLRRHHRQTLQDLPIGLCSFGRDGEVLMWNQAMVDLTGTDWREVVGSHISTLPQPWADLLQAFYESPTPHLHKQHIDTDGRARWISLHKAQGVSEADHANDEVIIVEDITETQLLEEELIHSERLASIGRLAAGVAHEIGNPVTGIACLAQNLKYDAGDTLSVETADEILQQTARITRIVQSLVNFAHAGANQGRPHIEPIAVARCVDDAIHLLTLNRDARDVRFVNDCPQDLLVLVDEQRLLQVFINLLSNARDASAEGAPVHVSARRDGSVCRLAVTDRGTGISAAHQEQVFEPFFTTKEPGAGTGLGLALVYGIIEELHGTIHIESPVAEQGDGTRIHICVPLAEAVTGE